MSKALRCEHGRDPNACPHCGTIPKGHTPSEFWDKPVYPAPLSGPTLDGLPEGCQETATFCIRTKNLYEWPKPSSCPDCLQVEIHPVGTRAAIPSDITTTDAVRGEVKAWMNRDGTVISDASKASGVNAGGQFSAAAQYTIPLGVIRPEGKDLEQHRLDQMRIDSLKRQLQAYMEKANGEFWYWQGDGTDELESLTCPILIRADDLRAILSPPRAGMTEEAQAKILIFLLELTGRQVDLSEYRNEFERGQYELLKSLREWLVPVVNALGKCAEFESPQPPEKQP